MLILASGSPRRKELMEYISSDFAVVTKPTDESFPKNVSPRQGAELLALRKARAVAAEHPGDIVVGADTIVVLCQKIFGKPKDKADAMCMLSKLSGCEHLVYTGVAIISPKGECVFSEETAVRFVSLSYEEIENYIATGEPMDKAGAYGIQGKGALLIDGITGDFYNVMGLPVCRLGKILSTLQTK